MLFSSSERNLVLSLALSATFRVQAVKCGQWHSTECLGDTDKRYDPDFANSIVEQEALWGKQAGYWKGVTRSYDGNDVPTKPVMFDPTNLATGFGLPYKRDSSVAFANITFAGSRAYEQRYTIYAPANKTWCADNPSIGPSMNALNGGECGVNGYASWTESVRVSSYEKDGSLVYLGGSLSFSQDTSFNPSSGFGIPIGEDTIFTSSYGENNGGTSTASKVWTFTNKAKTMADAQRSQYNTIGDVSVLIGSSKIKYMKITEEEFIQGIQDEWTAQNVQAENRGDLPMERACLGSVCATEEDWCKSDPDCSQSPYQEPNADVKGGVIAGFTIAGVVLLVGALYAVHRRVLKNQEVRIRDTFAKRLNAGFDDEPLTMERLQEEFKKIDTSNDGLVSILFSRSFII